MRKLYNQINRVELIQKMRLSHENRSTLSFYKYYKIINPTFFRNHLYEKLDDIHTLGRIYLATEGINAQISVPTNKLDDFKQVLNDILIFTRLTIKFCDRR